MKTNTIFLKLALITLIAASCKKGGSPNNNTNNNNDCTTVAKSFSSNVSPIISTSCAQANCHNAGSVNGPGELLTYQQIFNARLDIRSAVATGVMPKNSTLTQAQIKTITCWVYSGAPNN